jgi:hypothetical protein
MIPQKLHYCWLSGEQMPDALQRCLASWREVMPDYELVKWDCSRFAIESNTFALEAFRARKWAFAADYIRLFALYTEGGVYLDSDVLVKKRFDVLLPWDFFTSLEYHHKLVTQQRTLEKLNPDGSSRQPNTPKPGIGLQAAVLGGVRGHPFLRDCLEYYEGRHFALEGGGYYDTIIAPDILAMVAEKYGFRYRNEKQELRDNMLILPSEIFAGGIKQASSRSYAIHYGAGSWRDVPKPGLLTRASSRFHEWRSHLSSRVFT